MFNKIKQAYERGESADTIHELYLQITDIEETDDDGSTYCHLAASFADHQALDILKQKGAIASSTGDNGDTALYTLASCREADVDDMYRSALTLLDMKASAIKKNKYGTNAVYQAVYRGHYRMVRAFAERDVKMSIPVHSKTMLYVAAERYADKINNSKRWRESNQVAYDELMK